jgi:hypothetical protein
MFLHIPHQNVRNFFLTFRSLDCSDMPCPVAGMRRAVVQTGIAKQKHRKANLPLTQQKNRNPGVTVFAISHVRLAIHARPGGW